MKFIFIIVSLFIFSIYALNTRDVLSEELALEIEYLGSCKEFYQKVLPSIWVNRHTPCLPIQLNVTNNPDNNDLNTDLFCTNSDERRSIIHFAEIYDTVQTIKEPNFIVSLISSAPFRVLTRKTTVNRRPNCFVTNDYCNADNAIVNDCRTNEVTYRRRHAVNKRPGDRFDGHRRPGFDGDRDRFNDRRPGFDGRPGDRFNDRRPGFDGRPGDRFDGDRFDHGGRSVRNLPGDKNDGDHFHYSEQRRRGWIVNHDRIYIVSNQQVTNDCKTSITECCNYVTPALFGGICNNYAPVTLLDFPKEKHHKKPHNDKHRPNRPEGNRYDRPDGKRFDGNRFDGNRFDRPDGNRFDGNRFDRPVDNRPERPRDEQRRPSSESSRVVEPIKSDVAPFRTESDVVAPAVQTQRAPASKVKIVAKPKKAPAQKVKVVVVQQPQVVEEVEEREEREEPEQQEQQEQEQQEEAEETNEEEENKK